MKNLFQLLSILFLFFLLQSCQQEKTEETTPVSVSKNYEDLTSLFKEWRKFETPPLRNLSLIHI